MFFRLFIPLFLIITLNSQAKTLGRNWIINKDHSELLFEIPYLKFGKVTGRFSRFRGSVTFDEDESLIEKISLVIFSESINTGNKLRDGHLKSKDFFNVNKFPKITFTSNSITPVGPDNFRASGTLIINDREKVVHIDFSLSRIIKDTWGKPSILGTFAGVIDRRDFGLSWNKFIEKEDYLVGNQITFNGQVQLQPRKFQTDSSKHLIPINKTLKQRNKILRGEESEDVIERGIIEIKKDPNIRQTNKNIISNQKEKSTTWWIAYFSMGMIGFLSIINLMFQGKQFFIHIFSNYDETNKWGLISDAIVYSVGLVYVWAMWIIGFRN